MRKPTPLHIGSRIALLAPSSSVSGKKLDAALASTRFLGFDPVVFPTAAGQHGYFSGTDQERADDLNQAFSDSSIEGIFCIRGGYGAGRILPLLDYDTIQKNPKVFLGYSDITALHTVFNQICDFATLHAPMPGGNYINADKDTVNLLRSHLQPLSHRKKVSKAPWEMLFPGNAEGPGCGERSCRNCGGKIWCPGRKLRRRSPNYKKSRRSSEHRASQSALKCSRTHVCSRRSGLSMSATERAAGSVLVPLSEKMRNRLWNGFRTLQTEKRYGSTSTSVQIYMHTGLNMQRIFTGSMRDR